MSSTVIDSYGFSVISKMRAFRSDLRVRSGRLSGRGDIVVLFSRTAPPAGVQFRGGRMLFMCQPEEGNLGSFWCAGARSASCTPCPVMNLVFQQEPCLVALRPREPARIRWQHRAFPTTSKTGWRDSLWRRGASWAAHKG